MDGSVFWEAIRRRDSADGIYSGEHGHWLMALRQAHRRLEAVYEELSPNESDVASFIDGALYRINEAHQALCGDVITMGESYDDTHSYTRNAGSCVGGELE